MHTCTLRGTPGVSSSSRMTSSATFIRTCSTRRNQASVKYERGFLSVLLLLLLLLLLHLSLSLSLLLLRVFCWDDDEAVAEEEELLVLLALLVLLLVACSPASGPSSTPAQAAGGAQKSPSVKVHGGRRGYA
jgi:hypothetical protein